jgi:precorrin-3B synthase
MNKARSMDAPSATAIHAMRRGACPSVARPMPTGDGLLVRLRPKAASLSPLDITAISHLAGTHGNGLVEVTARGNLQVRGLTEQNVPAFATGLSDAGIALQQGVAIEIPPMAGLDPLEIADSSPLADALRTAIEDAGLTAMLAPKLSIVIDGGGVLPLSDMVADIRLDAVALQDRILWRLALAGNATTATSVACLSPDRVVAGVMTVLGALAGHGTAARGRDLDVEHLRRGFLHAEQVTPVLSVGDPPRSLGLNPVGREIVFGVGLAYGQATGANLAALATGLAGLGAFEFRLAPRRAFLVRGLPESALAEARIVARSAGFWTEGDEPGNAISVCAGSKGCASAHFDTRAVADLMTVLAPDLFDGSLAVHISGCSKGCAHPAPANLVFSGSADGVGLSVDGRASDPAGAIVDTGRFATAFGRFADIFTRGNSRPATAHARLKGTAPEHLLSAYQGRS